MPGYVVSRTTDLMDVSLVDPADGQVRRWDAATSLWIPSTPATGGGSSGLAIGAAVTGGGANRFLAEDAAQNLQAITSVTVNAAGGITVNVGDQGFDSTVVVYQVATGAGFGVNAGLTILADGSVSMANRFGTVGFNYAASAGQLVIGVTLVATGGISGLTSLAVGGTIDAFGFNDPGFGRSLSTRGATGMAFTFRPGAIGEVVIACVSLASQSGNLQEWQDSAGNPYSTVSENGYFTTRKAVAPADAELSTSEVAWWLDPTPGAAKAKFKARDSAGNVVQGEIALS